MTTHIALDHLICTVPDVAAGSASLGSLLGVAPSPGGSHEDHGTCNALLGLGEGCYLELLGPDPHARAPGPLAERARTQTGLDIWTFAVRTSDLEGLASRARALGVTTDGPHAGSRRAPDGRLLRWRTMYLLSPEFKGLVPFAIDWRDTVHPSRTSPPGVRVESMFVTHPAADVLSGIYRGLGIELAVHYGTKPAIVATLAHGDRLVTLIGGAGGIGV